MLRLLTVLSMTPAMMVLQKFFNSNFALDKRSSSSSSTFSITVLGIFDFLPRVDSSGIFRANAIRDISLQLLDYDEIEDDILETGDYYPEFSDRNLV